MPHLRQFLLGVAVVYLAAVAVAAFIIRAPLPLWGIIVALLVAGLLLGAAARPSRWWVALGFLWLGVAWVEVGRMVWQERQGSALDVLAGCAACAVGVAATIGVRRMLGRRPQQSVSPRPAAAPPRR